MTRATLAVLAILSSSAHPAVSSAVARGAGPPAGVVDAGHQRQDREGLAPGPPHESNLQVGEAPPTALVLESIDGDTHDLAQARGERPLLLLFFRGTW